MYRDDVDGHPCRMANRRGKGATSRAPDSETDITGDSQTEESNIKSYLLWIRSSRKVQTDLRGGTYPQQIRRRIKEESVPRLPQLPRWSTTIGVIHNIRNQIQRRAFHYHARVLQKVVRKSAKIPHPPLLQASALESRQENGLLSKSERYHRLQGHTD